jgi:hypothetical protein
MSLPKQVNPSIFTSCQFQIAESKLFSWSLSTVGPSRTPITLFARLRVGKLAEHNVRHAELSWKLPASNGFHSS